MPRLLFKREPMHNNFATLGCLVKFISGLRQSITHRGGTLDNSIWQEKAISFKGPQIDLKSALGRDDFDFFWIFNSARPYSSVCYAN